jgi:hypothetical protein
VPGSSGFTQPPRPVPRTVPRTGRPGR